MVFQAEPFSSQYEMHPKILCDRMFVLQADRLRRMMGDEVLEAAQRPTHLSADDLNDGFILDKDDRTTLAYKVPDEAAVIEHLSPNVTHSRFLLIPRMENGTLERRRRNMRRKQMRKEGVMRGKNRKRKMEKK